MINFSTAKPPNNLYNRCREKFGKNVDWDKGVIFTYGDTIYCKQQLPPDLIEHESTHVRQQEQLGKDIWWNKYFEDKDFRLAQEVEAYRNQWKYCKQNYNRKTRNLMWNHIINSMVTLYGDMCNKEQAEALIK